MGCGASKAMAQVAAEPAAGPGADAAKQQQQAVGVESAGGTAAAANASDAAAGGASASQPQSLAAASALGSSTHTIPREDDPRTKLAGPASGSSSQLRRGSDGDNRGGIHDPSNPTPLKDGSKEPSGESLNRRKIPAISKPVAFEIDLNETSKVIEVDNIRRPELPSKLLDKIDRSDALTPESLKAKQEAAEKRRLEREKEHQEKLKERSERISKAAQAAKVSSHSKAEVRTGEGRPATMEEELALAAAVQRLERVHAGDESALYGTNHVKQNRGRGVHA